MSRLPCCPRLCCGGWCGRATLHGFRFGDHSDSVLLVTARKGLGAQHIWQNCHTWRLVVDRLEYSVLHLQSVGGSDMFYVSLPSRLQLLQWWGTTGYQGRRRGVLRGGGMISKQSYMLSVLCSMFNVASIVDEKRMCTHWSKSLLRLHIYPVHIIDLVKRTWSTQGAKKIKSRCLYVLSCIIYYLLNLEPPVNENVSTTLQTPVVDQFFF